MQYAQRAPPNAGQPGGTGGPFYKKALFNSRLYFCVYNERQTTIENARENSHARTRG